MRDLQEAIQLIDALSGPIRQATACLRSIQNGATQRDAAYLLDLAMAALEEGDRALDEHGRSTG